MKRTQERTCRLEPSPPRRGVGGRLDLRASCRGPWASQDLPGSPPPLSAPQSIGRLAPADFRPAHREPGPLPRQRLGFGDCAPHQTPVALRTMPLAQLVQRPRARLPSRTRNLRFTYLPLVLKRELMRTKPLRTKKTCTAPGPFKKKISGVRKTTGNVSAVCCITHMQ
jgi:hypothetical protein